MMERSELARHSYHLVMARFEGKEAASAVLHKLRAEGALADCEIEGEALITRDAAGAVHVHEKGSPGIGAAFGAAAGGLIGLVTGPVFLVLLVAGGAVAGSIAGHFAGQALPVDDLRDAAESMEPGSSALVVVVDGAHAAEVAGLLEEEGGQVLDAPVETELASAVREAVTGRVVRG